MSNRLILNDVLTRQTKNTGVTTIEAFTALAKSVEKEITETVLDFSYQEGVSKAEAKAAIKGLLGGNLNRLSEYKVFLIWDSLGCDDLGYRQANETIDKIYAIVGVYWSNLIAYQKHVADQAQV